MSKILSQREIDELFRYLTEPVSTESCRIRL